MSNTISVYLVTSNSRQFLKPCFDSIFSQTYLQKEKFNIFVIDNASSDGSAEYVRENYPDVGLLKNQQNLGTSKAWNQAIKLCKSEFILITNADIILEPNFIEELLGSIQKNPNISAVGGKILRTSWANAELQTIQKTDKIDSVGLRMTKSRRFVDIGQGETDLGQFENKQERLGVSGACAIWRMQALEDVKTPLESNQNGYRGHLQEDKYEYFDEDFFMYKEEVDLHYRLKLYGWKSIYEPKAVCYHFRSAAGKEKLWDRGLALSIAFNRPKKSKLANFNSYRNHLCILYKNELKSLFRKHIIYIAWYEFRKIIFIILFEQSTFKALSQFFKLRKKMKIKRKSIMNNIKVNKEMIEKWIE